MVRLSPNRLAPPEEQITPHQLAELVELPAAEPISGSLWTRLDRAVLNASRARAEARRAQSSSFAGLDKAFNPHGQEARVKARAFLASAARSSSRLLAAMEELEGEAAKAKAAHESDLSRWQSDQRMATARADAMGQATARTLRQELQASDIALASQKEAHTRLRADENHKLEVQHAKHTRSLTLQFDAERSALHDETASLRARLDRAHQEATTTGQAARISYDDVLSECASLRREAAKLRGDLSEERSMREAEEQASAALKTSNDKLRAELSTLGAELEQTRIDLRGKVERLSREKRAIGHELESQLGHLHDLREAEVTHLQTSLDQVRLQGQVAASTLQEQLVAAHAERNLDASAYQAKIARLHAVHRAAISAGSARGRQLLYTESMRSPELKIASSLSWRGEDWSFSSGTSSPTHAHVKSPKGVEAKDAHPQLDGPEVLTPQPSPRKPSVKVRTKSSAKSAR